MGQNWSRIRNMFTPLLGVDVMNLSENARPYSLHLMSLGL